MQPTRFTHSFGAAAMAQRSRTATSRLQSYLAEALSEEALWYDMGEKPILLPHALMLALIFFALLYAAVTNIIGVGRWVVWQLLRIVPTRFTFH
jgi:hypothetical protein